MIITPRGIALKNKIHSPGTRTRRSENSTPQETSRKTSVPPGKMWGAAQGVYPEIPLPSPEYVSRHGGQVGGLLAGTSQPVDRGGMGGFVYMYT